MELEANQEQSQLSQDVVKEQRQKLSALQNEINDCEAEKEERLNAIADCEVWHRQPVLSPKIMHWLF